MNNKKFLRIASHSLIFGFFVISPILVVFTPNIALGSLQNPTGTLANPLKPELDSIPALFQAVLGIAAEIGAVFVVLGLIYSGFLFVMARCNEEELSKAKIAITYTVIGAAIVLGAWAFSVAIKTTIDAITQNPTGP